MLRFIVPSLSLLLALPIAAQAASKQDFELSKMLQQVATQSSVGTPRAINEDMLDQGFTVEGNELINHLSVREGEASKMRSDPQTVHYRQIGELSGGQKKRVFLARAIAQQGSVILLDEPFTGVDVQTEARIISLLRELRDEGKTMLVSTHNLGSVTEFCDYTVMVKGTVLASGPTRTTFTAANLERAFSGVLRHVMVKGLDDQIITDDERPFIAPHAAREEGS